MEVDRKSRARTAITATIAIAALAVSLSTAWAEPLSSPAFPVTRADVATKSKLRVIAFGSSSTQGAGASGETATYPARLLADLTQALPGVDVAVANRGIGGQDAVEFDARISSLIAERPDLVIFQTGTNDPLRGLSLDRFTELTRTDLTMLRNARIDVLLMEPQFCRVFADKPGSFAYVEAIRSLGREFGVPVVRRWDMMKDWLLRRVAPPEQLQASDGLHMADRGYDLLAQDVARVILDDLHRPVVLAGP